MGLDFAIEELFATGWSALDTTGCESEGGRWIPSVDRVKREFADAGLSLSIRHIQLFDCFRAEWADDSSLPAGSVVGQTDREAALYALAQHRRAAATAGV
ncbi:MAG: hypothetical protein AAF297_03410 [Planctomycetota bacterium]